MGSSQLQDLIESKRTAILWRDGLRIEQFSGGVLNVQKKRQQDEFTQADLDAFRALLKEAGYRDYESWVATQGMSWLNSGLFAGVSVRIKAL